MTFHMPGRDGPFVFNGSHVAVSWLGRLFLGTDWRAVEFPRGKGKGYRCYP